MDNNSPLRVIVAEKVADMLEIPADLKNRLRYEASPHQGIVALLNEEESPRTSLLLLLHTSQVEPVLRVLEGFSSESVIYRIVSISAREDCSSEEHDRVETPQQPSALFDVRSAPVTRTELRFVIRRAEESIAAERAAVSSAPPSEAALFDAWKDQNALIAIGKALSLEHNPDVLLRTILSLSKKITGADAGSIFLVEKDNEERRCLRFKYSHTFSKPLDYEEFTMPINTSSIAGYVAVTGRVLNISDAYSIDEDAPYGFNNSFDHKHGYRTKSMLVLPMRGNTNEVIGVIQLINSKEQEQDPESNAAYEVTLASREDFEHKVYPFKQRYEGLMEAVAGQAAIAIENNRMLKQIENQFEAFVKASVMAVESRDPATSGHSFRVATMCTSTAKAIDESERQPWLDEGFSALRLKALEFAGLLHDFGKVYIDPSIFLKEKKLFRRDFENLRLRLHLIRRTLEAGLAEVKKTEKDASQIVAELQEVLTAVRELNEPKEEEADPEHKISSILSMQSELLCTDPEGRWIPLLTMEDAENLRVPRGSLNPRERAEIQGHVVHTYNFVRRIPWPSEFAAIPDITYAHHEMLDGSGYPRGLTGKEAIPLEARIMAVADIFDALCAADRPYKPAMPREQAFAILRHDAAKGKLDSDVVETFISSQAWDVPFDLHRRIVPQSDASEDEIYSNPT